MNKRTKYIFLHIPKAAGSTFTRMLLNSYGHHSMFEISPETYDVSMQKLHDIEVSDPERIYIVTGHAYYGFHENLPHKYVYVTILRNPFDRVLSYLDFVYAYKKHWLHDRLRSSAAIDFSSNYFLAEMSNLQTRMLSSTFVHNIEELPPITRQHLELAKLRLRTFGAVGTVEEFDLFTRLVNKLFSWDLRRTDRQNVTRTHAFRDNLTQDLINKIMELNALDYELYQFAHDLFHKQLHEMDLYQEHISK